MLGSRGAAGIALLAVSLLSLVQTGREVYQSTGTNWTESPWAGDEFRFAGRIIKVIRPPRRPGAAETALVPQERVLIDGVPVGDTAGLRMASWPFDHRRSPHWFDAITFINHAGTDSSFWIGRRLQLADTIRPRFEIITLDARGELTVQMLSSDQLQREYRMSETTALIAEDVLPGYPLSLVGFAMFPVIWPIVPMIFPIGTSVYGFILLRRSRLTASAASPDRR